jgi:hypothetical protein
MKRIYVFEDGEMREKIPRRSSRYHYIQDDLKPYKSMIDGSMISSRSKHKSHLKQHGCVEVGNETMENKKQVIRDTRRDVLRAQLVNMTHREANRLLERVRDDLRFSNPHRK